MENAKEKRFRLIKIRITADDPAEQEKISELVAREQKSAEYREAARERYFAQVKQPTDDEFAILVDP